MELTPNDGDPTEFNFAVKAGRKTQAMRFKCDNRTELLCAAADRHQRSTGQAPVQRIPAVKITRADTRVDCLLEAGVAALQQFTPDMQPLSAFPYHLIEGVDQVSDEAGGIVVRYRGKGRLFLLQDRDVLLRRMRERVARLGFAVDTSRQVTLHAAKTARMEFGMDELRALHEFAVKKVTQRYSAPVPRKLVVNAQNLVVRDAATYSVVSCDPLDNVSALIRHEDDGQRFTVEFYAGERVSFISGERDTILAVLLDAICGGAPRLQAPVECTVQPRGLRVRYVADAAAASIEDSHLKHLVAVLKAGSGAQHTTQNTDVPASEADGPLPDYSAETVHACMEFNANVPCGRGLHPSIKPKQAGQPLTMLSRHLMALAIHAVARREPPAVHATTSLQTLYRLLATPAVNASALQAGEVRSALALFLRSKHLAISFWAMACLTALSLPPDPPLEVISALPSRSSRLSRRLTSASASATYARDREAERANKHHILMTDGVVPAFKHLLTSLRADDHGALVLLHLVTFIEGAICTYRDSSDTTARDTLLNLVAAHPAPLLDLFRSPCPSVVEAASLIMKVLISETGEAKRNEVQTAALRQGTLLRHIGRALFSPNPDNRYVSRYLVSLWAGGSPSARAMMARMVPAGLLYYMDMPKLSQPELKALLQVEGSPAGGGPSQAGPAAAAKPGKARPSRLRLRLDAATGGFATADTPENFPVFFHMAMEDHQRAELVWNTETRAELKRALEAELRELERERSLTPKGVTVAWNCDEFEVEYKSLEKEVRVGDHFLRLMLEEQDQAEQEQRARSGSVTGEEAAVAPAVELRDPVTFFNSLYMRLLRERNAQLRVYCVRALAMVYEKYWDTIGPFPDVPHVVAMVRESLDRALRDRVLLFLDALVKHPENAQRLLKADRIMALVDLMTLAHAQSTATLGASSLLRKQVRASGLMITSGEEGQRPDGSKQGNTGQGAGSSGGSGTDKAQGAASSASSSPSSAAHGAREWHYQDTSGKTHGPVSVGELSELYAESKVTPDTMCWASHMGEWVPMRRVWQLRWRVLSRGGNSVPPAEAALVCLRILTRLARMHPSVTKDGAVIRPVPRAKRLLASPQALPHVVQILLTEEPKLVDAAGELLMVLMENNDAAASKLYLTGFFYFAIGYTGSNFGVLSNLIFETHVKQLFRQHAEALAEDVPLSRRSILGNLLPESLLCVLENYGPEKFAETFLGDFDNPEVIWKYSMRKFAVEMVGQHLGSLRSRLRDNTQLVYDFCPMPGIVYEDLRSELWCHNFYLANLCDEQRFPEWPIPEPVELLRAVLDTWRAERVKEGPAVSVGEALKLLGVREGASANDVRKAYRKMAMRYHPDKNPDGRDTFEKIQEAYEILTNSRAQHGGPDPINILLIVRTQRILFKRFSSVLRPYKYAGYPYVLEIVDLRDEEALDEHRLRLLAVATELVYLTCLCSPLNAEELVREDGVLLLAKLLRRCLDVVSPSTDAKEPALLVIRHILHTFAGLATFDSARAQMPRAHGLFPSLVASVRLHQAPWVVKYALETISRICVDAPLQNAIARAGGVWTMLPLLFRFDASHEDAQVETPSAASEDSHVQHAANVNAKLAARTLGRLGGYLSDKLKTPENQGVRCALNCLLTRHLADMLRYSNAVDMLRLLNTYEETPRVIWNAKMRAQLLDFVDRQQRRMVDADNYDPDAALTFRFDELANELVVGGVYVRVYNEQAPVQVDHVDQFAATLADFVAFEVGYTDAKAPGFKGTRDPQAKRDASHHASERPSAAASTATATPTPTPTPTSGADEGADPFASLVQQATGPGAGAGVGADADAPAGVAGASGGSGEDLLGTRGGLVGRGTDAVDFLDAPAPAAPGAGAGGGEDDPFASLEAEAEATSSGLQVPDRGGKLASDNPHGGCGGPGCDVYARGYVSERLRGCVAMCLTALHHTVEANSGAQAALAKGKGLPLLFHFATSTRAEDERRRLALRVIRSLALDVQCATQVARQSLGLVLLQLLRKRVEEAAEDVMGAVEMLCNTRAAVEHLEEMGAVVDMLSVLCERRRPLFEGAREQAAAALGKMCSDPMHGPKVLLRLQRFLPVSLAVKFREEGGPAVTLFDASHETPDLIWNEEMRAELAQEVAKVAKQVEATLERNVAWQLPDTYQIRFRSLANELVVAGVYVRLYLKEPTFPLRDPRAFMEECLRLFERKSMEQLRAAEARAEGTLVRAEEDDGGTGYGFTLGTVTATVADEKLVPILTSAVVCVLKVRPSLADHVAHLGYPVKLVALAKRVCDGRDGGHRVGYSRALAAPDSFAGVEATLNGMGRPGTASGSAAAAPSSSSAGTDEIGGVITTSCVRLLHQIGENTKCVEKLAASPVMEVRPSATPSAWALPRYTPPLSLSRTYTRPPVAVALYRS